MLADYTFVLCSHSSSLVLLYGSYVCWSWPLAILANVLVHKCIQHVLYGSFRSCYSFLDLELAGAIFQRNERTLDWCDCHVAAFQLFITAKSMSIMSRFRQFSFAILDLLAIGDGWFGTRFGWYKMALQWISLLQNGFIHAGIMLLTCNDHQWCRGGSAAWKGCWGLGDPSCKLLCFQVGFVASPSFCPSFCPCSGWVCHVRPKLEKGRASRAIAEIPCRVHRLGLVSCLSALKASAALVLCETFWWAVTEVGEQVEYWSASSHRWMPAIAAQHIVKRKTCWKFERRATCFKRNQTSPFKLETLRLRKFSQMQRPYSSYATKTSDRRNCFGVRKVATSCHEPRSAKAKQCDLSVKPGAPLSRVRKADCLRHLRHFDLINDFMPLATRVFMGFRRFSVFLGCVNWTVWTYSMVQQHSIVVRCFESPSVVMCAYLRCVKGTWKCSTSTSVFQGCDRSHIRRCSFFSWLVLQAARTGSLSHGAAGSSATFWCWKRTISLSYFLHTSSRLPPYFLHTSSFTCSHKFQVTRHRSFSIIFHPSSSKIHYSHECNQRGTELFLCPLHLDFNFVLNEVTTSSWSLDCM